MLILCLQEVTIDWFQGVTHNLRMFKLASELEFVKDWNRKRCFYLILPQGYEFLTKTCRLARHLATILLRIV